MLLFFIFYSLRDKSFSIGALSIQTSTKTVCRITFLFCLEINDQELLPPSRLKRGIFRHSRVYEHNKLFACMPNFILSLLTSSFPIPSTHEVATRYKLPTESVRWKCHNPQLSELEKTQVKFSHYIVKTR